MSDSSRTLADRLAAEGEKIVSAFKAFPEESREVTVYMDGSHWRLQDVLAHFVSTEIAFMQLFEDIRAGGAGVSEDFSIERYNEEQVFELRGRSFESLLNDFRSRRLAMVEWVRKLSESDLELVGRHPFLGVTNLTGMIKLVYLHNNLHLRDIRKCV